MSPALRFQATSPLTTITIFFSVVMVFFKIIFCVKLYVNDIFLFLKNYF